MFCAIKKHDMPRGLLYPWLIQYPPVPKQSEAMQIAFATLCYVHTCHFWEQVRVLATIFLAYFLLYPNRRWLLVSDDHSVSHFALSEGIAGFLLIPKHSCEGFWNFYNRSTFLAPDNVTSPLQLAQRRKSHPGPHSHRAETKKTT